MDIITTILISYLFMINVAGFAMMGIDKRRAINGAWRISEATLFLTAAMGGSIGCIVGMEVFRHKTKHWYFKWGMPAILIMQIIVVLIAFC